MGFWFSGTHFGGVIFEWGIFRRFILQQLSVRNWMAVCSNGGIYGWAKFTEEYGIYLIIRLLCAYIV